MRRAGPWVRRSFVIAPAIAFISFILLPLLALLLHTTPALLMRTLGQPASMQALVLSIETTFISLALVLLFGTPTAHLLARSTFPGRRIVDAIVDLPIVMPPAVAGVALLVAFGRVGLAGPFLGGLGIHLSFSTAAVVVAQIFVSCPYYVRSARAGFLTVDRGLEEASATLGYGPFGTFVRVTAPLAGPNLLGGAVLTWARALGEFGATSLFAGNLMGVTQTMPQLVYVTLDGSGDIDGAAALSVLLVASSLIVLLVVRLVGE